jgi:hypothetical protein
VACTVLSEDRISVKRLTSISACRADGSCDVRFGSWSPDNALTQAAADLDPLNACVGNNGGPYDLYDYAKARAIWERMHAEGRITTYKLQPDARWAKDDYIPGTAKYRSRRAMTREP